jgi:hypothetical protein
MSDLEKTKKEVDSFNLPQSYYSNICGNHELQPVQAQKDSPADPAGFVVAPCRSLDERRCSSEEQSTEPNGEMAKLIEWRENFQQRTKLRGPDVWADRLVSGDEQWTLWRKPQLARHGEWRNYMLCLNSSVAVKRIWHIGWHPNDWVAKGRDAALLWKHYPEMMEWLRRVALHGPCPVPKVVVISRKEAVREKHKAEGTYEERRRARQRKRYQSKATARREKQETLANQVTAEMAEVFLVAIQMMWEAKTPCSIRRQAGMKRFAPAIFAEGSGLLEEVIEAWIKRMIAEGRIAEEMSCRKMRQKGLKVLQKKVEREEEGVSSSEGKAGGIKANG